MKGGIFVKGWLREEMGRVNIFNRRGEVIFCTSDMEKGWDGTFNGRLQKTDIYIYRIQAGGVDGNTVQKEGYVNRIK